MTPKYQERLYNALKSQYEADINKSLLELDGLFEYTTNPSISTYPTDVAIKKLLEAQHKLITLEEYINGSKPLKQLLND
jgi:hypothetical protein